MLRLAGNRSPPIFRHPSSPQAASAFFASLRGPPTVSAVFALSRGHRPPAPFSPRHEGHRPPPSPLPIYGGQSPPQPALFITARGPTVLAISSLDPRATDRRHLTGGLTIVEGARMVCLRLGGTGASFSILEEAIRQESNPEIA